MRKDTADRKDGRVNEDFLMEITSTTSKPGFPTTTTTTVSPNTEAVDDNSSTRPNLRDTGLGPWKALTAAILYSTILLGFPLTFGVFQEFFHSHDTFGHNAPTAWIGVLSGGLPYLGAPFMTYICQRSIIPLRYYLLIGWLICIVALVAGAFCKSLVSLVVTQGLCYGIGIFILDVPTLLVLNTWFLKRRGLAYGTLFAMTDILGFILSYIANALLSRHGLKITLLVFAAIIFVIPGCSVWLLTERVEGPSRRRPSIYLQNELPQAPLPEENCGTNAWVGTGLIYYRRPIFYLLTLSNLFQAFGFYLPFIYMPSFTIDLGHTTTQATTVLAVANLAQVIGEFAFGKMSDLIRVRGLCVLSSSLGASLATFLLWGLARSYAQLIVFAIIYGAFASGLIALWARIGTFFGEKDAQKIYSVMSFGRGIGNIASAPISAALLNPKHGAKAVDRAAYGLGKYEAVVLFVGGCMSVSAMLAALGFVAIAIEERTHSKKEERAAETDAA